MINDPAACAARSCQLALLFSRFTAMVASLPSKHAAQYFFRSNEERMKKQRRNLWIQRTRTSAIKAPDKVAMVKTD
jgi:hypothetical protein